jgi:hypothetical protein
MTTKHTPGPWTVQDGTLTIYTLTNSVTNAVAVACRVRLDGGSIVLGEEAKANAALIASAPDLYAALKVAADRLEEACLFQDAEAARAALAKAGGQQ